MAPFLIIVFLLDLAKNFNPDINALLYNRFGPSGLKLMLPEERHKCTGTLWYLIGVEAVLGGAVIKAGELDRVAASLAILLLAVVDPAASLTGCRFRSKVVKQYVGLIGAALSGSFSIWLFSKLAMHNPIPLETAAKVGLLTAAFKQKAFLGLNDNLLIPIISFVFLVCTL